MPTSIYYETVQISVVLGNIAYYSNLMGFPYMVKSMQAKKKFAAFSGIDGLLAELLE